VVLSTWEMAIKLLLGKLRLPASPVEYLRSRIADTPAIPLPITHSHALRLAQLPLHHRDPFDRMLIAQAETEGLVIMTSDEAQRRRDRPRPGPDFQEASIRVVAHDDPAGVAGEAPRRFRGTARAVLEDRLARLIRVRQCGGVDVDDHLIPLARGAGIDPVMEGGLGEQLQRVGPLLGHGRRLRRRLGWTLGRPVASGFLIQLLARRVQGAKEQRPRLRVSRPRSTTAPSSSW
jgi:hypothetical protein